MNTRNIVVGILVLVIVGIAFYSFGGSSALMPQPTPTPAADLDEFENLVTASGTLLPARRANLGFEMAGPAVQVNVKMGDSVKKGDLLVRLDAAEQEAAVAIAQAGLQQLVAGATNAELQAAQAAIDQAQAQLAKVRAGPTAEDIAVAKATLDRALADLKNAQSAYDKIKDDPAAGMYPQSQAYEAATQQYRIAEANYTRVVKGASPEDIRIAETNHEAAQAAFKRVQAGARPEEIAIARARLEQAQAAVGNTRLTAPMDAIVAAVNIREGEMVAPGVPIVILGDISSMRLETDDLSETDIARVRLDQTVQVNFEALQGQVFQGKVTSIAPISSQKQGGTNYTVIIEFDKLDPALRWGMTGHVEINTK